MNHSHEHERATPLDLQAIRERLSQETGPQYWRSLEELADAPEFAELLEREFQSPPPEGDAFSRRRFLQLMGASIALAGLNACTAQPDEQIVPYAKQPEQLVPGKPRYYATATGRHGGYAQGILVESHMGRPTKVEGNPEHPASLGSTDLFAQSTVLDLYDPNRLQAPLYRGRIRSWESFKRDLQERLVAQEALMGAGLRVLTPPTTSESIGRLMGELRQRFPLMQWHRYEAVHRDGVRAASALAFGEAVDVRYELEDADIIVSFDGDFLASGPWHLPQARAFGARRRPGLGDGEMNRLYCAESTPTPTGTLADHRLAATPNALERCALALAGAIGLGGISSPELSDGERRWVDAAAEDLRSSRGRSAVMAGDHLPAEIQALVHLMNEQLNNVGTTVQHAATAEIDPVSELESISTLVHDMNAGEVDMLLVLGGNPVFDAPAELDFRGALEQVEWRAHLSLSADETGKWCQWELPESHPLEAWSDLRAYDGTAGVVQPLIEPLYVSRSTLEIFAAMLDADADGRAIVRDTWRPRNTSASFEKSWQQWLHDGVIAADPKDSSARSVRRADVIGALAGRGAADGTDLTLILRPDPTIIDGSGIDNAWLQECPKPLTKLTWDNAALLAPADADALGVTNGDELRISSEGREIRIPVWILPGQTQKCITLHFGYGRDRCGKVGAGSGVDVYPLRGRGNSAWRIDGATVERTGRRSKLASTQLHHNMEGRDLVREGTFAQFEHDPDFLHHGGHHVDASKSLMPGFEYDGHRWGLAINLSACTGCNSCVVACQAENNVPVVGKDEVLNGREMHWIRIDHYFAGELDEPRALHQPVMCQHCEEAPCEVVCPVAATVHSDDGLNDMVYNRCVGTRYCSNNCPYKVRRFNYYQYVDKKSETLKMQRNPDVTVRNRGVMEKCSYCVQRISQARIEAKVDDLPLGDGQIVTACQQACPTQAIRFGDLNDADAEVTRWRESPLTFSLLEELGTQPRTSYLARMSNPHPELGENRGAHDAH